MEKFCHYCFAKEVIVRTDYKPLVAMVSKDTATPSHQRQHTMLCIHQYNVHILNVKGIIINEMFNHVTFVTSCSS